MPLSLRRGLFACLCARAAFVLPCAAQPAAGPGDAALQRLAAPDTSHSQFLKSHPGAVELTHAPGQLRYRSPGGRLSAVLGAVSRQDPQSGVWIPNAPALSTTANGWRLDGAANAVFIRKQGVTKHTVTQTFTDFATKHASSLVVTLPSLRYDRGLLFRFDKDGLKWSLDFDQTGAMNLVTVVAARRGAASYVFDISSSEPLATDRDGNLSGGPHAGFTRAVLITRRGRRVPCSPWTWSKQNGASFTCDDSKLADADLPYRIDPSSQVLTDPGTYYIDYVYGWFSNDDGSPGYGEISIHRATVTFNTAVIGVVPGSTNTGARCGYNVVDSQLASVPTVGSYDIVDCNSTPLDLSGTTSVATFIYSDTSENHWLPDVSDWLNNISLTVWWDPPPAAAPSITPPPGTYTSPQTITITSSIPGVKINYSAWWNDPDPDTAALYTGPFVSTSGVIKAIVSGGGYAASPITTAVYNYVCPPPTISPAGRTFSSAQTVILSSSLANTSIRYTTDGSSPSATVGTLYTAPFTVASTTTVKAITYRPAGDFSPSPLVTTLYTITPTAATPSISPAAGTYSAPQTVTLTTATTGAGIRYTTDGTQPSSTAGILYSAPFTLSAGATVNAIAYQSGSNDSAVASAAYTFAASAPTIAPGAGTYTAAQSVTLTSAAGVSIRYTTDGTTPTSTTGAIYTAPFSVAATATVKAIAYATGWSDSAVSSSAYTITGTVATPTFTPAAGTYTSGESVTISTSTPGASSRYTTDGSTPASTTGTLYTAPVTVSASATLKAIAFLATWADSAVAASTYTITGTVATPTFTPAAGNYTAAQSVTIATVTPGASIRYTTDGSTPTSTIGLVYSTPVAVNASATLKAIAYEANWLDSAVASAAYTLTVVAPATVPAAGTYTSAPTVMLSTMTPGASIRYTTDGTAPTSTTGTVYAAPFAVGSTATVKAIAYLAGWPDSAVTTAAYTITGTVAAPTFSVTAGTYTTAQTVALSTTTAGASIRYTTDGSTPTSTVGTPYTAPVAVNATATVKAIAYLATWADSAVASAAYTITGTVATPVFTPAAGTYTSPQTVSISTTTSGASIRYTTDGSTPTSTTGTLYTAPVAVNASATLQAIAYLATWADSAVASSAYTLNLTVSAPTLTPAAGTYGAAQSVTIATSTSGASIRYTTDGSMPTSTAGTLYAAPVAVNASATVKAIAYQSGWADSTVSSATYTLAVAAPSITPAAGTYTTAQTVTLSTATAGATVRYTTDGSVPTSTTGAIYTSPFSIGATATVKAIAYEPGWTDSAIASAVYTITGTVATPTFGVPAGTYTTAQSISLNTTTSGASIRYTLDGSTPSETVGTLYSAPIAVSATATLKAIAYESGWNTSTIASAAYTITGTVATPTFSVPAGTYTAIQSVVLSTTTPGATIRYTTDGSAPTPTTGTAYSAPVTVNASITLRAIAYLTNWNDSAMASAAYTMNLPPADFTMTLATTPAPWLAGMSGTFTFTLAASSTFNDTVNFSSAQMPGGATVTYNPSSVTLAANATATVTVTVATRQTENGGVAGYFNPIVTASATAAAHSLTVPMTLQDFGVTLGKQQSVLTLNNVGGILRVEYGVQGVNGFDATAVGVNWVGYFINPGDGYYSASSIGAPGSVDQGAGVVTMQIYAIPASMAERRYARIVGQVGTVVHYAQIEIDVNLPGDPDFTVSMSPLSQSLMQPGTVRYPIVINSGFNYTGQVSVSVSGVPAGATWEIDRQDGTPQNSYWVSGGAPQQVTLKVTTTAATASGTSPLTVTVTDGSIARTASVGLAVGPSSSVTYTVTTSPPGLSFTLNNVVYTTAVTQQGDPNAWGTVSAPNAQTDPSSGAIFDFAQWSDAGNPQHSFSVGSAPPILTATYNRRMRSPVLSLPTDEPAPGPAPAPTSPPPISASANACRDISGYWTNPNESRLTYSLNTSGGALTADSSYTYTDVCGTVTAPVVGFLQADGTWRITLSDSPVRSCGFSFASVTRDVASDCTSATLSIPGSSGTQPNPPTALAITAPNPTTTWTRSGPPGLNVTVDLLAGKITTQLDPQNKTSDLTIAVTTTQGQQVALVTHASARSGNSFQDAFRLTLPVGEYGSVKASWDTVSVTVPVAFYVVGNTRLTQYNTPYEKNCQANPQTAYVIYKIDKAADGYCYWKTVQLGSQFVTQVITNGTGVIGESEIVKGYNAGAKNVCYVPDGASAGNSFFSVDSGGNPITKIKGSNNTVLSDGTGAVNSFNNNNPAAGSIAVLGNGASRPAPAFPFNFGDQLLLIDQSDQGDRFGRGPSRTFVRAAALAAFQARKWRMSTSIARGKPVARVPTITMAHLSSP